MKFAQHDMDDSEKRDLLRAEYLHIQKVIDDFDSRTLGIKAWSVSFSLAALGGAFASHASPVLLVASFSALLFWIIEGFWKTFQYAYYDRAGKIEEYFSEKRKDLVPLQIEASWYKRWKSGGFKRLIRIMCWPHVALPHIAVFVIGLILFALVYFRKMSI